MSRTPSASSPPLPGIYVRLVLTALFWGGTWVAARIVVQEVPPFGAAFYRFLIATLATAWIVRGHEGPLPRLTRREWLMVGLMGLTGVFAYNYFFLHGLQHISAGRGALVIALNPALVALVAWLLFGDRMHALKATGIALALGGCLLVVSGGQPLALVNGEVGIGELMIFGCVVCWTLYTFIGRRATGSLTPLVANLYACAIGGALLGVAALVEGSLSQWPDYSLRAWLAIGYLGFFGTALSYSWFTAGVQHIGATKAAAFTNLVPVFGVALGALILHERLGAGVLLGGAVTVLGVVLTNRPR
ncbi:DMT family transporter [Uliginosibacterium sp. H1]|uniref:DMT family transporter n=1 Tax=Uliginosibacterium sp. H1 TaxID=3114757 RepID=UPI002E1766AA|nr:DMT family transporter [Uliginosibacterium sp. H1]